MELKNKVTVLTLPYERVSATPIPPSVHEGRTSFGAEGFRKRFFGYWSFL
jgi:hypothetical protein